MNPVAEEIERIAREASRTSNGPPDEDSQAPEDTFPLLRDLLANPEMLQPPEEVLPRFAWRGRTTLYVGPDKTGKSTLAGHGVGALTNGRLWLGSRTTLGTAVVVAPDEAIGDTVRRLHEAGANPDRVRVLALRPPNLLTHLDELLASRTTDLVVVDSLAEWARLTAGQAPDDGDSAGWGSVVRPMVDVVSRRHGCALLLLHHPRRSDGQFRGSGEIAAAVDCLVEMRMPNSGEDPTLRRFSGRARWPVEDFSIRMEAGRFQLGGGGPVPLEARVMMDVGANPGTSRTASHQRIGGRKQTHTAAVNSLLLSMGLVDRGGKLYLRTVVEEDLSL